MVYTCRNGKGVDIITIALFCLAKVSTKNRTKRLTCGCNYVRNIEATLFPRDVRAAIVLITRGGAEGGANLVTSFLF